MNKKMTWGKFIIYTALVLGLVMMLIPFLWMISTSLKNKSQTLAYPPIWIPNPIYFSNYAEAIQKFPFFQYLWNNIKITGLITLGTTATSAMAGYAFACMRFKGRDALFMVVLGMMMIPGQVTMIPVFLLVKQLGMINTHSSLIVPSIASSFGIFLMRQYFVTLPQDLEDAAYVDGCKPLGIFFKIFLPLAGPAVAALFVLTVSGSWNSFMWPLILISDKSKQMLSVGLLQFTGQYDSDTHLMMAAATLTLMPLMILYLFTQRYFIEGIAFSGVKG
jgi:multiple sugar transport system permease protein